MTDRHDIILSEAELERSQTRMARLNIVLAIGGFLTVAAVSVPADMLGSAVATGPLRYVVSTAALAALLAPVLLVALRTGGAQQAAIAQHMTDIERQLTVALERADEEAGARTSQIRRQDFESRLANALEMAEGETEVIDVVVRAFRSTIPDSSAELLLADNSHAHLARMAVSSPLGEPSMCSVDSPDHCPATRRAQTQKFNDSDAIDACPKLRDREGGRCSAVCVPVSIMGRTVGVIHTTDAPDVELGESTVQDLGTLAKLTGSRLGLLRMVAETQVQASTDALTGLLNRRSLENKARALQGPDAPITVVMADLDHFKALNDAHGHETGDRGLRLFAQTLKASLRGEDLLARYGGEEFAAVLPKCTTENAEVILERVRLTFTAALQAAGLPLVTASFGVVASHADETLASSLRRADVALFQAKHEGRDRIVVHDLDRPAAPLASVDPFEPFRDATLADAALTDAALNNGH